MDGVSHPLMVVIKPASQTKIEVCDRSNVGGGGNKKSTSPNIITRRDGYAGCVVVWWALVLPITYYLFANET